VHERHLDTLQYPEEGLKDSIQGVVTVSFIINEIGSPEKIQIENSLGEAFDRETIKMIEQMPRWNPATVNGKPIASRLAIPLTFQIKKINNN
jgi:protein TonB